MPIFITDNERAGMASAVRKTVDTLGDGNFAPDVIVDRGHRLFLVLVREEAADLVGHVGQSFMRHGEPIPSGCDWDG